MNSITHFLWLNEVQKRLPLPSEMEKEFYRLKAGDEGEQFVVSMLKQFGEPHWKILTNVWLKYNGHFECDIVVLTREGIYIFEVKNYTGHFEFKDMKCFLNGHPIGFNPINQAQYTHTNFANLIEAELLTKNVRGALVFVGEHNTVRIHNNISGIKVVMRNELRNFIWEMAKQERDYYGETLELVSCLDLFQSYSTENIFKPDPITEEMQAQLQRGICCSSCSSFNIDMFKSYIQCVCGMAEPRENAIVRSICEYGVIHFDKDLVTRDICVFFDNQVSRNTILKYLKMHFTQIGHNRNTVYYNSALPFKEISKEFNLPLKRTLCIDYY